MANTIRKVHPNFHGKKGLSGRKRSPGTVMKYLTEKIDDNWPRLVDALIEKALGGDKEMIQYCFDRRLGKPKVVTEIEADEGLSKVAFIIAMKAIIEAEQRYLTEGGNNESIQGQINEVPTPKREEER